MLKSILMSILLLVLISSCSKNRTNISSVIEVNIDKNSDLDSLIIYDKENSWEIKSCLRFINTRTVIDSLSISDQKIYQVYAFRKGMQSEFGEILIAPDSNINLNIEENKPTHDAIYKGTFEIPNNFLAYAKKVKNELTNWVRKGIDSASLNLKIAQNKDLIVKKSNTLNIVDSLKIDAFEKFDAFSNILKKKNKKYRYKASLINLIGNNFSFKDVNNTSKSLQDFKGKYVYIDVWATWCKPCKVEHKFLEELETYFSNNKEFQIISISTDRDYEKWKKYVIDNSMKGIQMHSGSDSEFVKFYDIGALPRFIFLDKEGKIISPDEIRPSNTNLKATIEGALQKV